MKLVLLTNILNPYRKAFYDEISKQCKERGDSFHVLVMSAKEYNREWNYEDYKGEYSILLKNKTFRIKHLPIYLNADLKKRLQELQPDIVVMAGGYMLPSVWKAVSLKKKLKYKTYFWSESHLDEQRDYDSAVLKVREWIRKKFYPQFDGFWYPGEKALEFIKKYANPDAKYYRIPNLIDNVHFQKAIEQNTCTKEELRDKYGLAQDKYVMFAPMRLHWVKGLEPFMEIVAKSKNKGRIQLAVAGNGELEEHLKKRAQELSVDLKLLGYHEEADIIELYQAADCFFMSSLSDPSPLTCVEALWCGLPLFVSEYVGNYPEVVEHGKNGYVYEYKQDDMAIKLLNNIVESDIAWRNNARKSSLHIAETTFECKHITKNLLDEMHNVK